jgi:hypothetical protein
LYPYGDTRTDVRPAYDDQDERAARWTIRLLAVALFVVVIAGTLVVSLMGLEDEPRPAAAPTRAGQDAVPVTAAPRTTEVGPPQGTELPAYLSARKAALGSNRDDRVAVVSLAKYGTQAQAKAALGSLAVEALLVAPPGVAPAVVVGDLAAWAKSQTDATRAERDELRRLIPTVDDPAFKTFYTQEADRLDKALTKFAVDSAMVFGAVVRGPATALQALGARPDVRLVDVGETATFDAKGSYRGLRPEETAKANEPALRPA